jgi:GNAT superfamily N-acetyltransferase
VTAQVTIREATDRDRGALEALYLQHHLNGPRIMEVARWYEAHAEVSGGNRWVVAVSNGIICGAVNVTTVSLACGGVIVRALWRRDSFVLPAYRGQGLGARLTLAAAGETPLMLAKGTSAAMARVNQALGFTDCSRLTYLLRVLKPVARGSMRRRVAFAWALARAALRRRPARPSGVVVRPLTEFDESVERVAGRLHRDGAVRLVKTRQYWHWRYRTAPGRRYVLFRAERTTGFEGLAVLRLNEAPGEEAWLVDLMAEPGGAAAGALVDACVEAARTAGAAAIRTFATAPAARQALAARGFVSVPSTPRFAYWARPACAIADLAGRVWDLWHGDGDVELYE